MKRSDYFLVTLLGVVILLVVAAFQSSPGYMDADYYYACGLQIADGKGFVEPFLWNYLDDPGGIPHPSHAYWMPLASILAAAVPVILGHSSFFLDRLPFYIITACIPPLTAAVAYGLSSRRDLALTSAFLAVFSGFYLPFLSTSDTFGLTMLLGGVFILVFTRNHALPIRFLVLGILAGLLHLSRADGFIWLVFALLAVFNSKGMIIKQRSFVYLLFLALLTLMGYLLVMAPWLIRNYHAFGSALNPGGSKMLWLTSYNQIFSYPSSEITFSAWWQTGLGAILKDRLWALGLNLANTLSVQAGVFLLPLILIGAWVRRKDKNVRLTVAAWILILFVMTVIFPYAGARGGFFHSGATVQVLWWALAPIGLERVIRWGCEHRGWHAPRARPLFLSGLVGLAVMVSVLTLFLRLPAWSGEASRYGQINAFLSTQGMEKDEIVIVSNPPGFYLASGNSAIALPDGTPDTILGLASDFHATYLVLEEDSTPSGLLPLFNNPDAYSGMDFIGELDGVSMFRIQP